MAKATGRPKEEDFSVRVPGDLKMAFEAAAGSADRSVAQIIVDFMRDYVEEHRQPDAGYENWFRAQVQASIDDPRPNIPHDEVMRRTQAVIDRVVLSKAGREG